MDLVNKILKESEEENLFKPRRLTTRPDLRTPEEKMRDEFRTKLTNLLRNDENIIIVDLNTYDLTQIKKKNEIRIHLKTRIVNTTLLFNYLFIWNKKEEKVFVTKYHWFKGKKDEIKNRYKGIKNEKQLLNIIIEELKFDRDNNLK